jgi:hypothetical protein
MGYLFPEVVKVRMSPATACIAHLGLHNLLHGPPPDANIALVLSHQLLEWTLEVTYISCGSTGLAGERMGHGRDPGGDAERAVTAGWFHILLGRAQEDLKVCPRIALDHVLHMSHCPCTLRLSVAEQLTSSCSHVRCQEKQAREQAAQAAVGRDDEGSDLAVLMSLLLQSRSVGQVYESVSRLTAIDFQGRISLNEKPRVSALSKVALSLEQNLQENFGEVRTC